MSFRNPSIRFNVDELVKSQKWDENELLNNRTCDVIYNKTEFRTTMQ